MPQQPIILKDCTPTNEITSLYANNMLKAMRARFAVYSQLKEYVMATACDPRFLNMKASQEMFLLEFVQTELEW